MGKPRRRYFISYSHPSGFGNTEVRTDYDLDYYDHRNSIQKEIAEKENLECVIILFYKKLPA